MYRLRSRRGVSLVDAMITIALVLVAGTIFGAAFPSSFSSIRQSSDNATATAIAQQKFEQIRALGYESINYAIMSAANPPMIDADVVSSPYSFTTVDNIASQLPQGTGTITITDESATVKRIVITVKYVGPNGINREVVLSTFVADKRPKVG